MEILGSNSLQRSKKNNRYFVNNSTSILAATIAYFSLLCGFNSPAIAGDSIAASVSIDFNKGCNCINTASSAIAIGKQNAFAVTTANEQSTSGASGASGGSLLILGLSSNGAAYQYMGAEHSRHNGSGANTSIGNSIDGNTALTTP
jgi:hypothetical protein